MTQLSAPPAPPLPAISTHPLVSRITRMRARVRAIIAVFGLGVMVAAALGGIFFLMSADYLLHIPSGFRITLLLALIVGLGILAWRLLVLPLSTRLTDQFLASRVENINKHLADELMSAVNFIHSRAAVTNALAAKHIDLAAQKTASIRFEDAVDFRQAGKSVSIAAVVLVVIAVIGALNPSLAKIALARWFTTAEVAWPHSTQVSFDWSAYGGHKPAVLPLGETVELRAMVEQGNPSYVMLYHWTDKASRAQELPMTFQKGASSGSSKIYATTLQPDGQELSLHVVAGDDTEQPAINIHLAPRPVVTQLQGAITPPKYVRDPKDPSLTAPSVMVDLLSQTARAVQGSAISIRVKTSKPLMVNANGEPEVHLYDINKDEDLPFAINRRKISANEAQLDFPASKSISARVIVRDTDNFENRSSGTVNLEVVPDAMPSVVITDPRRPIERVPGGEVDLSIQATDDQGLDGLKILAERFDAKPGDPPLFESPIKWLDRTVDPAVGSSTGTARYVWDLAPLKLTPGAHVTIYAMVQDNYDVDGKRHDWVRSQPLQLTIESEAQALDTGRRNLNEVKERIDNLNKQQQATQQATQAIQKAVEASNVTTAQQKMQLENLALQQAQEAAAATSIENRTQQIADDLRQNKMGEGELGKLAQDVAQGMQSVGQENMPKAAAELNKAQDSAGNTPAGQNTPQSQQDAKKAAQSMSGANKQQGDAIAKMDDMLKKLANTSDYADLKHRVDDLVEKQAKLNADTAKTIAPITGKAPSELTPQQQEQEKKLAKEQADLGQKTAETINDMNKAAQALSQSDPASSQSLQNAAQAGTNAGVPQAQQQASSAISQNQSNSAGSQQSAAQQGLQQMQNELNKNDRRQLEQLALQLRALLQEVTKLRDDEVKLNTDSVAATAATSAQMQKLGDRQGTLQQNALVLEKKAENTQKAKAAAPDINDAADAMADAAGALYSSKQKDSLEPETKSIAALEEAIKKLAEATKNVEAQLKDKQLAQYIKDYEAIKKDQETIKVTTGEIQKRKDASVDHELEYLDAKKLGGLSETQNGLITRINQLSNDEKLKAFEVVVWMNGQVIEMMTVSKDRLSKEQLGPQVASAQQGSIDRINLIIDALKEEQKRNEPFQQPSGGGGGGGGGQKPPLVPPLAQLKLLKAMQKIVNDQTVVLDKTVTNDDAEKHALQMETEKVGQKEGDIKDLADRMIKKITGGQ